MLGRDDLIALSDASDGLHVSITMPTHRAGADTRENPIRFKNHVQEAARLLGERGLDAKETEAMLASAHALVADHDFWQHQQDGFAFYLAAGEDHPYRVPLALPELTLVSNRFHLKPLMPLLTESGRYYFLVVSQHRARLFEGARDGLTPCELPEDTPRSLEDELRFDEPASALRQHTGATGAGGNPEGIAQGTGDVAPDRKEQILRFFKHLDNGVRKVVAGAELPLLFMGVDYLFPLYKKANHYPHLLDVHVGGNPDALSDADLAERGWSVMEEHFARGRIEAMQRYKERSGLDSTSDALEAIVPAAVEGRVDTLIVGVDVQRWGAYDAANRSVRLLSPDAEEGTDLLDFAAVETLRNGGTVYAVEGRHVPDGGAMVAIFRY